ncbi:MAG: VanZ family protein [Bacteroidota bacterium]|nr:VanZ family protein [Bacteroidota bacterium]
MNQSKLVSFFQFQLPAIAWALFIFTVSSIPAIKLPSLVHYSDKVIHAGVFFVLCWFLHIAFHFQGNKFLQSRSLWIALILTSVFGISDEYHQLFTPGRSTEFFDWVADTVGAAVYVLLYLRFKFYSISLANSK